MHSCDHSYTKTCKIYTIDKVLSSIVQLSKYTAILCFKAQAMYTWKKIFVIWKFLKATLYISSKKCLVNCIVLSVVLAMFYLSDERTYNDDAV